MFGKYHDNLAVLDVDMWFTRDHFELLRSGKDIDVKFHG